MRHAVTGIKLVICLALLSAGPAFTQSPSDEEISKPTVASAPVAHVYVQTTKGVNVYDAAVNGKLTLVKGSPFATTGQMEGVNGKYLLSVGTTEIRAYAIESSGAVGKQASSTDTQNYRGSECGDTGDGGNPNGAVLDHTGQDFYVQLWGATDGGDAVCAAWQTYKVASSGELTFVDAMIGYGRWGWTSVPSFIANDGSAYFAYYPGAEAQIFGRFVREPNGALNRSAIGNEIDPTPDPNPPDSDNDYFPIDMAADPAGHLAVAMTESFGSNGPPQLASYTTSESTGDLESSNTWADMPTPEVYPSILKMSPSGKLLAVAGGEYFGRGLQIFHFNGAAPITTYSSLLLPTVNVDQLAWDNSNHLYALSYSSGELYVYTATPTSISEVSGSPYKVENAYGIKGLIVVPKL
jgi:hypothetical protein